MYAIQYQHAKQQKSSAPCKCFFICILSAWGNPIALNDHFISFYLPFYVIRSLFFAVFNESRSNRSHQYLTEIRRTFVFNKFGQWILFGKILITKFERICGNSFHIFRLLIFIIFFCRILNKSCDLNKKSKLIFFRWHSKSFIFETLIVKRFEQNQY